MSKEKWGLIDKHSDWEFGDWVEALVEMTKHRDAWQELCGQWVRYAAWFEQYSTLTIRPPEKPEGV